MMNVKELVQNELELSGGVYFLRDQTPFNYSDGDQSERYVHDAIRASSDISSGSRELELHIRDWSSLYHLSRERPLVYASLHLPRSARVLEVGCGCGAITRFLGETVEQVVALEGSPRRAEITRERTRDLSNVTVLCGSFEDVIFNERFDFVVCNGVLEYAPLFVKHQDPADEFIRRLSRLLTPSGFLIVAIENKFGLRYFSSGREEHTNIRYDGIEGYARFPHGPITFGFSELHRKLSKHCSVVDVLLPLPDYKLPSAVIRAELVDKVNCADLFADLARTDFGTYEEPRLHERLVWHGLNEDGALRSFANSFVMIASHGGKSFLPANWMGDIYSVKRLSNRATRTTILASEDGSVRTQKRSFTPNGPEARDVSGEESSDWISGVSVHTLVARAMLRRDTNLTLEDRLRDPVLAWWAAVRGLSDETGSLAGSALDCIWQNAILRNGSVTFIDKEWMSADPIAPSALIYRAVAHFVAKENPYLHRWSPACQKASEIALMRAVATVVNVPFSFSLVRAAMERDRDLLATVHGRQSAPLKRLARLVVPLSVLKKRRTPRQLGRLVSRVGRSALRRLAPRG